MKTNHLIDVAVGIVVHQKQVLLAQRPQHSVQGGMWEFPGGKIEDQESSWQALLRELDEEVGITVLSAVPLSLICQDYTAYQVQLHPWIIKDFTGVAFGREGQSIRWVSLTELPLYEMPAANKLLIEQLTLPLEKL